jgi:hypothetical protein
LAASDVVKFLVPAYVQEAPTLAAVLRDGTMIGVITASRLLELVLSPN